MFPERRLKSRNIWGRRRDAMFWYRRLMLPQIRLVLLMIVTVQRGSILLDRDLNLVTFYVILPTPLRGIPTHYFVTMEPFLLINHYWGNQFITYALLKSKVNKIILSLVGAKPKLDILKYLKFAKQRVS